jgi:hypothetical protein
MSQVQWLTALIPATQEAENRRIKVQGPPGKKLTSPHLNKQARRGSNTSVIPVTWEAWRGSWFKVHPEQKTQTLSEK